jgi:hypothetical protein
MRWWNVSDSKSSFAPIGDEADHSGHSGRDGELHSGPITF